MVGLQLEEIVLNTSTKVLAARFIGDPFTENVDDNAVVIRVFNASIGKTFSLSVASSGGGTPPANQTGTVTVATFDLTFNLTPLNAGTLTASYSEDGVVVSTSTALLIIPFEYGLLNFNKFEASQYVSVI